jgi:sterol 3beta-glucosyltransferase
MKITILTYGSAGDVVPYISLALGLMDRNHEVILAAPQNFESQVKNAG